MSIIISLEYNNNIKIEKKSARIVVTAFATGLSTGLAWYPCSIIVRSGNPQYKRNKKREIKNNQSLKTLKPLDEEDDFQ